jgi:hypothetical protein
VNHEWTLACPAGSRTEFVVWQVSLGCVAAVRFHSMLSTGELHVEWIPMTTSIGCVRRVSGFSRSCWRLNSAALQSACSQAGWCRTFQNSARYDAIGALLACGPLLTDSRRMPPSSLRGADSSPDGENPRLTTYFVSARKTHYTLWPLRTVLDAAV